METPRVEASFFTPGNIWKRTWRLVRLQRRCTKGDVVFGSIIPGLLLLLTSSGYIKDVMNLEEHAGGGGGVSGTSQLFAKIKKRNHSFDTWKGIISIQIF